MEQLANNQPHVGAEDEKGDEGNLLKFVLAREENTILLVKVHKQDLKLPVRLGHEDPAKGDDASLDQPK
jgi:hypothetical protein